MNNDYGHDFYKDRHQRTVYSARTIISLVLDALPPVRSAVDFGCGVGTWLSVLKEKGVAEIQGLDGPWVELNLLEIPEDNFRQANFEENIRLESKYDLAITLEVAEHLPHECAGDFVESLVEAADFVVFSAAIPYQGGRGHINEQWPDYWARLFEDRGYVALDFIRKKIWNDNRIPVWYRQNIILFARKERVQDVKVSVLEECNNTLPLPLVHPELYRSKVVRMSSVKGTWRLFLQAAKIYIQKALGKKG